MTALSLLIQGKWVKGSGPAFTSSNPATGECLWSGCETSADDVQTAVSAARSAFRLWSTKTLDQRITCLIDFRDALSQTGDLLAETISKETGKPLWESKTEVASMIAKIAISIDAYTVRCPETVKPYAQNSSISVVTRHRPHGVLAVFGPFNFPGHLPNGHIIPALLAGNAVIFKPSELTPLVAEITANCWLKAGLPEGTFTLLQGGRHTGQAVAQCSGIDGILFTGSWSTGSLLSEQFARTPHKILALEMGGNNPYVIGAVSDAHLQAAAHMTIQSAFLTTGQRCTCARRLIVPQGKKGDTFLELLLSMIQKIQIGPYTDRPEPFMGPVISTEAANALLARQQALIAAGGIPLKLLTRLPQGTAFLSPALIDVTEIPAAKRCDEEIFGPLLQLIRVPDFPAALAEANNTHYGLAAGLLSDDPEEYRTFYSAIRAGIINWNTPLTGASSSAPFGGIGHSGNHRPSAFYAADYCAYPVVTLEIPSVRDWKEIN